MAFGKKKEPKAPEEKPKKEKPPKKPKPPKKEKAPKKEKPPKKGKPPKKPQKGQEAPGEGEELEQEGKKKKPIILLLIPIAVIAIAAVVVFVFVLPNMGNPDDPGTMETEEPKPPELPEKLEVGDVSVPGMTLEADESGAQSAVIARSITYTYTDLNDAGAAAETYVGQLRSADPSFSVVDEDFVRTSELPDFTASEGMVLLARNLSKDELETEFGIKEEVQATPAPTDPPEDESGNPESSAPVATPAPTPTPEPVEEPPSYVIMVRITWTEGKCVVVAGEEEGKVTSPSQSGPGTMPSIGVRGAMEQLKSMTPAELGLPGTSMSQYEVFAWNETELVNGVTCIRLDVYNSSTGPNPYLFASGYLMSVDGAHLYKLDPVTDEIQELDFTLKD